MCWLAAGAWGLIPIVNAATTARGLVPSLMAHDWVFVGFDVSALAAGLFFAFVARRTANRTKAQAPGLPAAIEATA